MESGNLTRSKPGAMQLEPAELASPSVPYSYVPLQPQEPGVAEYWRILLKRKWTVIAFAVIVFTLGTVATFRMTRIYDAVARIAINRENPEPMGIKELSTTESDDWDYTVGMDTQIRILEGDTLAWQVIQGMHLDSNPKFAGGMASHAKSGGLQAPAVDTATQDALLGMFHGGLRVSAIPNTRLVEIRYSSSDPQMAADIANNLANSYVELNRRTKYEATMQASDWLSRQLADLQIKVETSQQKLIDYQKSHGIVGTDDKENIVTKKLDDLNKQLTDAQADRIQKQANYQLTLQGNPDLVPGVAQDLFLARLREQEADLRNQLAQLTTQFGPSYPKVVETNNRLKQVETAIQNEITKQTGRIKSDYDASVGRERMLEAALEQQKQEATKLNESAIEYSILKREADTNRQLYDGLLQKLKEAGVTAGLQASNIRVVDAARVPLAPSKPDIPRNLGIALLLGLTGGVALAFVLEVLDNTVRTPEQVEAIAALPSLGIVPLTAGAHQANLLAKKTRGLLTAKHVRPNGAVGLVAYSRPKSGIAESFRALRTSILLSSMGAPPKTIVVTSALPREGKTTTSVNSAVVLAQKGGKVLLVDADMRRPGVHQVMGLSSRSGLSTVLTGSDSYANAILQSRQLNNLYVLPAGPTPPHPAELLGSPAMKKLLDEWSAVYDHIVIDTPPILSVTDPVVLSVEVDAVVLVIRSGQTSKDALRRARDLLTQVNARVMGVVVNAVDLQSPDLSYHYYYGSKYGGSYYEDGVARN